MSLKPFFLKVKYIYIDVYLYADKWKRSWCGFMSNYMDTIVYLQWKIIPIPNDTLETIAAILYFSRTVTST